MRRLTLACSLIFLAACGAPVEHDVVLRGGTIYDGTGSPGVVGDIAIDGDLVVGVGDLGSAVGRHEIEVDGLAVSPGFVNMLSWATESLIADGRAMSDVLQGVTLEVMGEGDSMGPLDDAMKEEMVRRQGDIVYDVEWTSLDEYLRFLEAKGVSPNIASFIGAATPREHVIGHDDRPPTAEELDRMRSLVRTAMEEGALGVASALIYPPGSFAATDELVALAEVAAEHDGMYISHVRGEGRHLVEAVGELVEIARRSGARAEIYHLKASGRANWPLFDEAIALVEAARAEGLAITADVYPYPAGATGLNASMPPWVQEGGFEASLARLTDPALRDRIAREMLEESDEWENMYLGAGSPENILLIGFRSPELKRYTGMSLAEVAAERGASPETTAMDLIVEDGSRVTCVYFSQSEEVLRRAIALPWVSFCSDEGAPAPEGVFLKKSNHPRAYGSFARVFARYVRDERIIPIEEAVRKLTGLPAANLKLDRRGLLRPGFFADVVVFDPATIQDHATFTEPHQLATGVEQVFVNGVQVVRDGEHTGATPGRVVRGPGWTGGE
ncbi:MAG: D-aminoacylase [Thermoanaerobaculales bacterium]|jgi:N-acyl-D-amino-acid deacylase|nr:D-aminoacylase [Thermoanaerobaculales bacterium]